jgi:hypothetical protein
MVRISGPHIASPTTTTLYQSVAAGATTAMHIKNEG